MNLTDFEYRVRAVLKKRGISQTDFAKRLGISLGRFNNFLNGRSRPNIAILSKMADELNTTIDYIMGRTDNYAPLVKFMPILSYQRFSILSSPDGEDNIMSCSLPLYESADITSIDTPWLASSNTKWIRISIFADEGQIYENSYAMFVTTDNMSPYILKGDTIIVWGAEVLPKHIKSSTNDMYAFKRSNSDEVGLSIGFASYNNDNIIVTLANLEKYSGSIAFNMEKDGFLPISGKVICVIRKFHG